MRVAVPQLAIGIIAAWLMRRFDGRLIRAVGFVIVAVAYLMNAQYQRSCQSNNRSSAEERPVPLTTVVVSPQADESGSKKPFDLVMFLFL